MGKKNTTPLFKTLIIGVMHMLSEDSTRETKAYMFIMLIVFKKVQMEKEQKQLNILNKKANDLLEKFKKL